MSLVDQPLSPVVADDKQARRNVLVLALAQALAGGNVTVVISTAGIVGAMLAPNKGLATLPITAMVFGMWFGTLPVGVLARRFGRRFALQLGSVFGVLSGLISYFAVLHGQFWLLLIGTFFGGLYGAAHQSYRFAAADTASERFRPKAIAWVLTGGIFAAVIGPQLVIFTRDMLSPYLFAATYLGQSVCALLAAIVLHFIDIAPPKITSAEKARPLLEIVRSPSFIVAATCGMASYGMMNMVMTSAPLAMVGCGHSVPDAMFGIQWHVLAMYSPSFFTGSLIARHGVERVTALGFALMISAALIGIAGTSIAHFWTGLVLLGFGWNFSFIGATTMVTGCHTVDERNKVQAFNDFLVFGSMAASSFLSGQLLAVFGWTAINTVVLPTVLAAGGLLAWRASRARARPA
jgi:predicted MFS family arabinose efflux permease